MPEPSKLDLYQTITDRIVAALESGPDKVSLPWHRTGACSILPRNAFTGHAYNGINVLSLWATAEERQYPRSLWATYRQWLGLDAQVRKGEKAALVVFYKQYEADHGRTERAQNDFQAGVQVQEGWSPAGRPVSGWMRAGRFLVGA